MIPTELHREETVKQSKRPRSPTNPARSEATSHYPTLLAPHEQIHENQTRTRHAQRRSGETKARGGTRRGRELTISGEFAPKPEGRRPRGEESAAQASERARRSEEGKGSETKGGRVSSRGGGSRFDVVAGFSFHRGTPARSLRLCEMRWGWVARGVVAVGSVDQRLVRVTRQRGTLSPRKLEY